MRSPGYALCLLFLATGASADNLSPIDSFIKATNGEAEFRLGGAATEQPLTPPTHLQKARQPRFRFAVPRIIREGGASLQQAAYGSLSFLFGEGQSDGLDVYHLGTAITNGSTTAGVTVTYEDREQSVESSELFIDYALTEQLSVGISSTLDEGTILGSDTEPEIGLNAQITSPNGTFLQGGVTGVRENDPVFGVSIGLRF